MCYESVEQYLSATTSKIWSNFPKILSTCIPYRSQKLFEKFAINFENFATKDIILHSHLQKKKIKLSVVLKWVEKKFGVEIDSVLLSAKILQGISKLEQIKPLILKKELCNPSKMKKYFLAQSNEYLRKAM